MKTETEEHLLRICREAGLQSAIGVFEILYDRDALTDEIALTLSHEDVSEIFTEAMGPAVDKAESLLLRHGTGPIPSVTACGIKVTSHRTFADPDQVTCLECKIPDYYGHRREMSNHLRNIAEQLDAMHRYWEFEGLPGDFLADDVYPFPSSLDEFAAQVRAAADRLKAETDAVGRG